MECSEEKFTIKITDSGVTILGGAKKRLDFTASQALMLLDILRTEEKKLKKMAEVASPIPIHIEI